MKKKAIQLILLAAAIFIALFVLANGRFFWQNIRYIIRKPQANTQGSIGTAQSQNQPNQLEIPSLGISAPILYASSVSENEFQKLLLNGVVHYPGTAKPGALGNCYIFGHSSDYLWSKGKYKTVFATLTKISKGDKIFVSDEEGNRFEYAVTETKVVAANDLSVLDQKGFGKKLLTLQTSWPVGTALKRFIVIAEIK